MVNKKRCTETTTGVVVELRSLGIDDPTVVSVGYEVDGVEYKISETLKYKSTAIKIGFLPIGMKKSIVMGEARVGTVTSVSYNPSKPSEAYITNNVGHFSI